MPLLHILMSAIVQGITEFLPISSSGHLLLLHSIWGETGTATADQTNLLFDIAVHIGTLFAVLLYFRKDVLRFIVGGFKILTGKFTDQDAILARNIIISSIPVIIAGLALHVFVPYALRETWIIATTTILFGILLWFADESSPQDNTAENLSWKSALFIGLSQILALIPGTSRSGITMTAARFIKISRTEAARYSLLLSTIAISGAGALGAKDLIEAQSLDLTIDIALAAGLSFVAAMCAITLMMKWLTKQSFRIFALYRILLGIALFAALGFGLIA